MTQFRRRLAALENTQGAVLRGMKRGIEKEGLRVTSEGRLAQTPHPPALGSALKHPWITTDFSEALLEFITPACDSIADTLARLDDIHRYTCTVLAQQGETLWCTSMPCALQGDSAIPIAQYGSTHAARMKTIYREGLGLRYGRVMQTIAGIHYNVSFPDALWQCLQTLENDNGDLQDFKTRGYFSLIRNFRRHLWLLLYLFGASPAVCPTFVQGREHHLQSFDEANPTLYVPHATSLRMGDLGYQSNAQTSLVVCYNSLSSYISTLKRGLTTPYPLYETLGLRDASGYYHQLSTNLLQIENEFYSTIRPKRVTQSGETPIRALHQRGVEYIEVRCLDVNPYSPVGIDSDTAHFMEVFLLWCLLNDSAQTDEAEYQRLARNQRRVVEEGRRDGFLLEAADGMRSLKNWAMMIRDDLAACATLLDQASGGEAYAASVQAQCRVMEDSERTPAARVLADMRERQQSFFRFASEQSRQHMQHFVTQPLSPLQQQQFSEMAQQSLMAQQTLEQQSSPLTFEQYLAEYYAQYQGI